ncbi:ribonuclease III family protein [Microbacterium sp.]|uniref:ribonuclease III family protein n=1 Tax=Microbacterium sp. TaxID=51671 RepID=UPI003A8C3E1A
MLTHRSWVRHRGDSYERLELLGDAVLQLVVTAELMRRHGQASEGDVAWMRQGIVSRETCARVAQAAGLPGRMQTFAPASASGSDVEGNESVAAALTEAVIGGGYLDLGLEAVEVAVLAAFAEPLSEAVPGRRDAKTTLQELAQADGRVLRYELVSAEGPAHRRRFTSHVLLDDVVVGRGVGASKQASQQQAAAAYLAESTSEDDAHQT